LSRVADAEGDSGAGTGRLDLKRETENYLSRKAGAVLERAFGPGQALASVDATLNMEQVRVTTEDVIAAPDVRGGGTTGVLVRERESARDTGAPEFLRGTDARASRGSSTQRDAEYQAGRRVEQVVSQPGSIRRLQVVAVLRPALDGEQQEQVRRLVAAAVGASFERGDTVVVQSFVGQGAAAAAAAPQALVPSQAAAARGDDSPMQATAALAFVVAAVVAVLLLRRRALRGDPAVKPLDEGQRRLALRKVEAWLEEAETAEAQESTPLATGGQRP
jgi:flagellar M-ring protein FliF